jgi:plastocyanin
MPMPLSRLIRWSSLATVGVLAAALPLAVSMADEVKNPSPGDKAVAVEGTVTYTGPIPDPVPVLEADTVRHLVEVSPKTRGLKDAVVWLEGMKVPTDHPMKEKKPVVMDQKNHFFVPHVLAVEAGQEVEFLNSDPPNHGVLAASLEDKNCFNVVTPPGGSYKHRFVAGRNPAVALSCPLHANMAAWVFVFAHPYHAVTDASGKYRLPPVPPGAYTLVVQHPDGGMRRKLNLTVKAEKGISVDIEFGKDDLKGGTRKDNGHSRHP